MLCLTEKKFNRFTPKKPSVPLRTDHPVMGIQSGKNFINTNAADVIMGVAKKPKPIYVDKRTGDRHDLETSGLLPKYINKKVILDLSIRDLRLPSLLTMSMRQLHSVLPEQTSKSAQCHSSAVCARFISKAWMPSSSTLVINVLSNYSRQSLKSINYHWGKNVAKSNYYCKCGGAHLSGGLEMWSFKGINLGEEWENWADMASKPPIPSTSPK